MTDEARTATDARLAIAEARLAASDADLDTVLELVRSEGGYRKPEDQNALRAVAARREERR